MPPPDKFRAREKHLRERAARDWHEDQDVVICIREIDRLNAILYAQAEILYPHGNPDAEWSNDEIELIAQLLIDEGLKPERTVPHG